MLWVIDHQRASSSRRPLSFPRINQLGARHVSPARHLRSFLSPLLCSSRHSAGRGTEICGPNQIVQPREVGFSMLGFSISVQAINFPSNLQFSTFLSVVRGIEAVNEDTSSYKAQEEIKVLVQCSSIFHGVEDCDAGQLPVCTNICLTKVFIFLPCSASDYSKPYRIADSDGFMPEHMISIRTCFHSILDHDVVLLLNETL